MYDFLRALHPWDSFAGVQNLPWFGLSLWCLNTVTFSYRLLFRLTFSWLWWRRSQHHQSVQKLEIDRTVFNFDNAGLIFQFFKLSVIWVASLMVFGHGDTRGLKCPLSLMSSRESSSVLLMLSGKYSPWSDRSFGSISTSQYDSRIKLANWSWVSLWRMWAHPTFVLRRACVMLNFSLHWNILYVCVNPRPYRKSSPSRNSNLIKQKSCFLSGREISQLKALFCEAIARNLSSADWLPVSNYLAWFFNFLILANFISFCKLFWQS